MFRRLLSCLLLSSTLLAAEPKLLLDDPFTQLAPEWFWGLGTWTAKDGVLRGFESGPRRHGPVKMRKLPFTDAVLECEFRLEGEASFAGILFNGSQERGHIVHLVMGRDSLRVLAHPQKGQNVELLKQSHSLAPDVWHQVKLQFTGPKLSATIDGHPITAEHPCISEPKQTFGLGGDSGGPAGEKAGALEFRKLKVVGP